MAEKRIRALMIGAHPDDCEFTSGGLATKLIAQGHTVKFVSASMRRSGICPAPS
jgi:LmbE family N-acetylglucosaminyl deacetylase